MREPSPISNYLNGSAIHLSLQGKGGVGKSFIASILAQYFLNRGHQVQCIDTDPVNHTLAQYKQLPVKLLKLLRGSRIDERRFDALLDTFLKDDVTFVVDNGAATFIPLWNYILESEVLAKLHEAGKPLYVHTILTGGQALADTLEGFRQIAESTTDRNIIVWINEYFGPVEWEDTTFLDMAVYKLNEQKILGMVTIPRRNQDTFGQDIEEMVCRKQTFREAFLWEGSSIMTKQRLKIVQRQLFEQLDKLDFAASTKSASQVVEAL